MSLMADTMTTPTPKTSTSKNIHLRQTPPRIPKMPELQCVRHYTRLSQKNFSIDTHTYPLGSCTMKYNPKVAHSIASLPGYNQVHPLTNTADMQ